MIAIAGPGTISTPDPTARAGCLRLDRGDEAGVETQALHHGTKLRHGCGS